MKLSEMIPVGNAPYGYSVSVRYFSEAFGTEYNEMSREATELTIKSFCKDATLEPDLYHSSTTVRIKGVCDYSGGFYLSVDIQP